MEKQKLRSVTITFEGTDPEFGLFHRWFEKRYGDGTNRLFAVVELRKDGAVFLFDTSDFDISFDEEEENEGDSAEDLAAFFP